MIPSLDIIIVNWNSGTLLSECIHSINDSIQNSFVLNNVVVVDNASSDNSLNNLNNTNLPLTIIRNTQNLGFAKACNQGAKNSEADFLLFLNPDTRLFKSSLTEPIKFMLDKKNNEIGILGVQMVDDKNNISRTCSRLPSPFVFFYMSFGLNKIFPRLFPNQFMTEWNHKNSQIVDQVMGAFFFVRRKLFQTLNGFDEKFFVYFEEVDFTVRAKQIGFKSYFLTATKIYHKGGGTSEKVKADRLFYILNSKLLFAKKHFSGPAFIVIAATTILIEPFIRILGTLLKGSFSESSEIIKGYKKLLANII
ncbi:MAG: glycosyltransferase family 2 protein [Melioribacteraceae bacterium]